MREEFEKLAVAGKIEPKQIEQLVELTQSGFCTHRSWGFGKITTVDTVFSRFLIDFTAKPGHSMDLGFAAKTLTAISREHILARKATDLPGLRQMAALNHLDLIKLVLQSFGGSATAAQIQGVLVPEVIADDWRKWWEAARKEIKKNGHFRVPIKKSEPIVYDAEAVSLQDRLLKELAAAKGLKAKIAVASEMFKSHEDISGKAEVFAEVIERLNKEIATHKRTQPSLALDAIFVRDDLREAAGVAPVEGEVTEAEIWENCEHFGKLLEGLPAQRGKRTLASLKAARPESWSAIVLGLMNHLGAKLVADCANVLIESGLLHSLKEMNARLINQHQASSELLLWLAKARSDTFADILGPEVFRAMLTAMERDQFNEKKSNRLGDFILSDKTLLTDLIEAADLEVVKDVTRALQMCSCFEDMDKRSLLARIVKIYPLIQSLITGEHPSEDHSLIVSWESLKRRRGEYEELVQRKIPGNSKEIAIARSYGDLRENHEYKAAKETQKILMRHKAELEMDLSRARGTDFSDVKAESVGVGTRVSIFDVGGERSEELIILGAWDSDPDRGVISYLSPLAKKLLNHRVGDVVEFDEGDLKKRYRIDAIKPFRSQDAVHQDASGIPEEAGGGQRTPGVEEAGVGERVVSAASHPSGAVEP